MVLANLGSGVVDVFWKPCSSCWSSHLLREEFYQLPFNPLLVRLIGPSIPSITIIEQNLLESS
jgi:hypothetical protein